MGMTHHATVDTLSIIIGLLLLLVGRRIFWIFVGGVGFFTGLNLAPTLIPEQSQLIIFLVAVTLAIVGAILAVLLQRVAVAVAGWFVGGILAVRLMSAFGWSDPGVLWIASIVGAIVSAIVVSLLFDWALIVLTTFSGALLICDSLTVSLTAKWILGIALVAIGIFVQSLDFRRRLAPG
jgi:hypothetical protein